MAIVPTVRCRSPKASPALSTGGALIAAALVAVWTFTAAPAAQTAPPDVLLSMGKAGPIEVGMPVDDLYRAVGRSRVRLVDLFREGMFDPALEIRLAGASGPPSIVAPFREWPCLVASVQGIFVHDPKFRTSEGLGVGSTLGQLRHRYEVRLSSEEGPHAWVERLRMNFRLESGSGSDAVRIRSIWIPGDPAAIRKARCPERGPLPGEALPETKLHAGPARGAPPAGPVGRPFKCASGAIKRLSGLAAESCGSNIAAYPPAAHLSASGAVGLQRSSGRRSPHRPTVSLDRF
jgi:hypothetical protein